MTYSDAKSRVSLLCIVVLAACCLMVASVSASPDVTHVNLTLEPGLPGANAALVCFHINTGLTQNNGIFITFDENTDADAITNQCIWITYNGNSAPPNRVIIIHNPDSEYAQYGFPDDTTTIKMDVPFPIPFNNNVCVNFTCLEFPCPINCSGINVWANTDVEPKPVISNKDYIDVEISGAVLYGSGTIRSESGAYAPFTERWDCGYDPTYTITPGPCNGIDAVYIDGDPAETSPYGELTMNPDGTATFVFDPLHCSHVITAGFDQNDVQITAIVEEGCGNITSEVSYKVAPPDFIDVLNCSEDACYRIKPCISWRIKDVLLDNTSVVNDPTYQAFVNGSAHYCINNITVNHTLKAKFERAPVDVYLKYQVPLDQCGYIVTYPDETVQVAGFSNISDALEFTDCLWQGGDSANFTITGHTSGNIYGTFSSGSWTDGSAVGDSVSVDNILFDETEHFKALVNYNDGTQAWIPFTITSSTPVVLGSNVVKVLNVMGTGSGSTPGYSDEFDLMGSPSGTNFGSFSNGVFVAGDSLGEKLDIVVTPPAGCPETYIITYIADDSWKDYDSAFNATITILEDGQIIWAPAMPQNVVNILDVIPQMPAWHLSIVPPDEGGLIGAVIVVQDGMYAETIEMDTPGVVLRSMNGAASTIIDANGIAPEIGNDPLKDVAAVLITAGCTQFEGFTVRDAGRNAGGSPDIDGNGYIDARGIVVHPQSWKCMESTICDYQIPCRYGRVNILNNTVHGSMAEGILAINTTVLVAGNDVYENCWDGFAAENITCGVECIDPEAITHGYFAVNELLGNAFHHNGFHACNCCVEMGKWTNVDCTNKSRVSFTMDGTNGGKYAGWIDSGIEIRSIQCCMPKDGDPVTVQSEVNGENGWIPSLLYIVDNEIYENTHAGISLWSTATPDYCPFDITIVENQIRDNGVFGISSAADEPEHIIIKYNNIVGNEWWGIKNWNTEEDLIAKENYWGMPGGPSMGPAPICHEMDQRSYALGNGDAVSHYVHYNPWLYTNFEEVLSNDPTRYYGSDSLELQEGWNTLSVPLSLADEGSSITSIKTLGRFLIDFPSPEQNYVIVLQYNAATQQFEIADDLIPARGYYIKMLKPSKFPVLYSGEPGFPSFPVDAGWNLVGAAFGIDRYDDEPWFDEGRWAVARPPEDPESFKTVEDALDSLISDFPRGASTVVSPSVPGQIESWGIGPGQYAEKYMYTGEGYWVYMVNPGTLSGFEITPFHFTFSLP